MSTASPPPSFALSSEARRVLEKALETLPLSPGWLVEHLALQQLQTVIDAEACHLVLEVTLYLLDAPGNQHFQLDLQLTSTPWQLDGWLTSQAEPVGDAQDASLTADSQPAALCYTLTQAQLRPEKRPHSTAWLHYMESSAAWRKAAAAHHSVPAQLEALLPLWLDEELSIDTLAGAQQALSNGPVGYFGPLEACVLERSGQADLAIDATLLAETNDAPETADEPSLFLSLMGERFGLWLLYRRQVKMLKPARRDAPAPAEWTCSVQIAESAAALIAQCALIPAEKRLFQQAGCLPHAMLRASTAPIFDPDSDADASPSASPGTALDLSCLADRPRRHLQAIVQLAQQGKLDNGDIDLLFKTARQFSKSKAPTKSSTTTPTRTPHRR